MENLPKIENPEQWIKENHSLLTDVIESFPDWKNNPHALIVECDCNDKSHFNVSVEGWPNSSMEYYRGIIYAKSGSRKGEDCRDLNEFINNKLLPNTKYFVDNCFVYMTDGKGRVAVAICFMDGRALGFTRSIAHTQTNDRVVKTGGINGDDAGHIFKHEINGPNEAINLVPMAKTWQETGEWKEREDTELKNKALVPTFPLVRILHYNDNDKRPCNIRTMDLHIESTKEKDYFISPQFIDNFCPK